MPPFMGGKENLGVVSFSSTPTLVNTAQGRQGLLHAQQRSKKEKIGPSKTPRKDPFSPERMISKDILLLLGNSSPSQGCRTQQFSVIITHGSGLVPDSFAHFPTDRLFRTPAQCLPELHGEQVRRPRAPGAPGLGFQIRATSPKAHNLQLPRGEALL